MESYSIFMDWKPQNSKDVNLLKLIYISYHNPSNIFIDIDMLILKFVCKCKETRVVKIILKKNKVRGISLPNFKTLYSYSN